MRIGVFGGTFDPVHVGHLILAERCREEAALEQVWFVPAFAPPHKQRQDLTPAPRRVEMLNLATGGNPAFVVSEIEIARGGVSYTVQTLQALRESRPEDDWYLILGGDSLVDLPTWREPAAICEMAGLLVVARPGSPEPNFEPLRGAIGDETFTRLRRQVVSMPLIGVSSRELRMSVRQGRSIRYQTPRAVEAYIHAQGLYRETT